MYKSLPILLLFVGGVVFSCDQKVDLVLPLVGLYGGEIIGCDFEELPQDTTMMDSAGGGATPFVRRVAIAYVSDFVNENEEIVKSLGVKPDKKFLVVQTSWLCVNEYTEEFAPLDTLGAELITTIAPVVVEVTKSQQGRTNFIMVGDSQKILDLGESNSLHVAELTGFYYNASLQMEYKILKNGRGQPVVSNTLVGLKN